MTDAPTFGRWLKQRRKTRDLTQDDLAREVGCSIETIRKIETDKLRPSRQIAERIAEQIAIPPEERPAFVSMARGGDVRLPTTASQSGFPASGRAVRVPAPPTRLTGREAEVAVLHEQLLDDDVRLLTLTGPPGIGKTRLAIHLASLLHPVFADGAYWVALAQVDSADRLVSSIAYALDTADAPGRSMQEQLVERMAGLRALLVLDNFEQMVAAAPVIAELLGAAPGVTMLVTSRVPLHLLGESECAVPPLPLPELLAGATPTSNQIQQLLANPAAQLFVARAQGVKPSFVVTPANAGAVAELCRRLDGLPLAIELAAVRAKLLTPATMLRRLDQRLQFLTGAARSIPARQQTLHAAIEWSYDLLDSPARQLFARLAVFAGGGTLESIEQWQARLEQTATSSTLEAQGVTLDALERLVDNSLLRYVEPPLESVADEPRFVMLETIRAYAWEQLEQSGAAIAAGRAHALQYLAWAEAAEPWLTGPDQRAWRERFEAEHDNLRAALKWTLEHDASELFVRLAGALWRFWLGGGYLEEGGSWLEQAVARAQDLQGASATVLSPFIARALVGAGGVAQAHGDHARSRMWLEGALEIYRALDDHRGAALALNGLGLAAHAQGEPQRAQALLEESLSLARAAGDRRGMAVALNYLGQALLERGDAGRAHELLGQSLSLARELGEAGLIAVSLQPLALLALIGGNVADAQRQFGESVALCAAEGERVRLIYGLEGLAGVAVARGEPRRAARLFGAAEAARGVLHAPISPIVQSYQQRFRAAAEALLAPWEWERERQAGLTLTLAQAATEALATESAADDGA